MKVCGIEIDFDKSDGFYINDDCMKGMKEIPDKYFDLAIVDPPYGINATEFGCGEGLKDHAKGSTARKVRKERLNHGCGTLTGRALNKMNCKWDSEPPAKEYFEELFRICKNSVIWGGNYFDLPPTRGIVIWDKVQPW